MAKNEGNQNARKGTGPMRGQISARCQPTEERLIDDAAKLLKMAKSEFVREAVVRVAADVVAAGHVPEWAKRTGS